MSAPAPRSPAPRRSHPKRRAAIKWIAMVVSVLLLLLWVGSTRYSVRWSGTLGNAFHVGTIGVGGISCGMYDLPPQTTPPDDWSWDVRPIPFQHHWGFFESMTMPGYRGGGIALWPLALTALALTAWAWRHDSVCRRRERVGFCPACGYDRAGIATDAKCPECGANGHAFPKTA